MTISPFYLSFQILQTLTADKKIKHYLLSEIISSIPSFFSYSLRNIENRHICHDEYPYSGRAKVEDRLLE
nr:MAG TPA: hypothetical protein [Crassvirales sp.]